MKLAVVRARRILQSITVLLLLTADLPSLAAEISVSVHDADGNPVPNVAVFLDGAAGPTRSTAAATMDQVDTRFVPHLLVIQTGTLVEFPNSDTVAHHVYSFSAPNDFVLPLYKGDAHAPIKFEHNGVVTLGCNIHDDMLAYILVVDTPVFALTDEAGIARLDSAASDGGEVRIWSPRLRGDDMDLRAGIQAASIEFELSNPLRDPHDHASLALAWKDY